MQFMHQEKFDTKVFQGYVSSLWARVDIQKLVFKLGKDFGPGVLACATRGG